jgi:hypothetical protein
MPLAEFAYNNIMTGALRMMPFNANYDYHSTSCTATTESNTLSVSSVAYWD